MSVGRKIETRFVRKVVLGHGIGIDEAVAAAEARVESMRDIALSEIRIILTRMRQTRLTLDQADVDALVLLRAESDALVGLCAPFGLAEIGEVAVSLCKLFDACQPEWPTTNGINVHLDAMQIFLSLPLEERARVLPQMLEGLSKVAIAARRRSKEPTATT